MKFPVKMKRKQLALLLISIGVLILICCYIGYKYINGVETFQNFNKHSNYHLGNNPNDKHHLYWTGGFDSTFRLCELLVNEGKVVQPIYVSMVLDNDCQSEENCKKLWLRRNRDEERKAMDKIRQELYLKFPFTRKTLLPTIEVEEDIGTPEFNQYFDTLFYENNLWPRKRRIHQYLFLSKYAFFHKLPIDIGVVGTHEKSYLYHFLDKNLIHKNHNKEIANKSHPVGYLRFPLFKRPKKELFQDATRGGYNDILKHTWSCWFPQKGKPCGRCPMCKERVIEHPGN